MIRYIRLTGTRGHPIFGLVQPLQAPHSELEKKTPVPDGGNPPGIIMLLKLEEAFIPETLLMFDQDTLNKGRTGENSL